MATCWPGMGCSAAARNWPPQPVDVPVLAVPPPAATVAAAAAAWLPLPLPADQAERGWSMMMRDGAECSYGGSQLTSHIYCLTE